MNSANIVELGQTLQLLNNPGATHINTTVSEIRRLKVLLETLSLHRAAIVAQPLFRITTIYRDGRTGRPTPAAIRQLEAYMRPISAAIYSEIEELRVERTQHHNAAIEFSQLATTLTLNSTQSELLSEAIKSFSAGAFRSCMVMTWNSVYDYMRQWVFDNRQNDFNASLTTQFLRSNGSPVYAPITDYNDFMTGKPSERTVIDTWHTASIISERIRDDLRQCLRRRNDCAHSTLRTPDQTQASAFARDLLDIAKGRPFA